MFVQIDVFLVYISVLFDSVITSHLFKIKITSSCKSIFHFMITYKYMAVTTHPFAKCRILLVK